MNRLLAPALLLSLAFVGSAAHAQSTPKAIAEMAQRKGIDLRIATTADALGMFRLTGPLESLDLINRMEFVATGKMYTPARSGAWAETPVKSLTFGMSTHLPATRADFVLAGPGGAERREIRVFRENLAWNETEPGVGATPAQEALSERQDQLLLMPHAFMRAVLRADPKTVRVAVEGGKTTYTVTVDGVPVKGTVSGDRLRPERVEMAVQHPVLGRTTLVANYSGYKDWEGYEVYFPERINYTLGGKPFLDLTVTKFLTGPYLVWPVPEAVRATASR